MHDTARFDRLLSLFDDAQALARHERGAFLQKACGEDDALRADVLDMLEEHDRHDLVLDGDVRDFPRKVLFQTPPEVATGMIERYRLEQKLGEGGMGVVWRAFDTDLQRRVALKLAIGAEPSQGQREQFDREQRNLAKLNHPFIASLYDAKVLRDGTPWFAMEYIDGVSITTACKELTIEQTLKLFRDVCEAVHHAHLVPVIHCDLKPANVLVTKDGIVKLLDFGISKQLLDSPLKPATTKSFGMTYEYAAPEQIDGEVSVASDVYSLGVVLYELLVGKPPFNLSNLSPEEKKRTVQQSVPARPSSVAGRKAVPGLRGGARAWADLDAICLTAMHKDKARRYKSVGELISDLERYQRIEPLKARRSTVGYRTRKFTVRNWRALATTAAVAATMIGMAGAFTVNLARERDKAQDAATRASRTLAFTNELFNGGDPEMPPADLKVTALVDNGIREAEGLDNEPEVQAELYHSLGVIAHNMDELDRADGLVTRALDQRRALFRREHPQVADSLIALSLIRMDQTRLEHAESLASKGLEIRRRQRPFDPEAVADALTALGRVRDKAANHTGAIAALKEAEGLLQTSGGAPSQQLANTLTALANAHNTAGAFEEADRLNLRVLAIDRERFGDKHIYVAKDLINLGASKNERGHHTEGERYCRQALAITEGWYKPGHTLIAANLRSLAQALVPQEKLDEAEALLKRGLAMEQKTLDANHPSIALTVHELGNVSYRRGDYDEAGKHFKLAAEVFTQHYGDDHNRTLAARAMLATVAVRQKRYSEADPIFRDVIERQERTTPGHVNVGFNRVKLGRSLVAQKRYREAIDQSLAGYTLLKPQINPSSPFMQAARYDLVVAYEALNEPERAAPFRQELKETGGALPPAR